MRSLTLQSSFALAALAEPCFIRSRLRKAVLTRSASFASPDAKPFPACADSCISKEVLVETKNTEVGSGNRFLLGERSIQQLY